MLLGKKSFIRVKMTEEESRRKPFFQSFDTSFANLVADFQREINELKRTIEKVSEENICLRTEVAEYKKSWVPNNVALWKQSMNQLEKESKNHEFTAKQLQKAVEEAAMWKARYNQVLLKDSAKEETVEYTDVSMDVSVPMTEEIMTVVSLNTSVPMPVETFPHESTKEKASSPEEKQGDCTEFTAGKEETMTNSVDDSVPEAVEKPISAPVFKTITIKGKEYLFGVEDNYVYEVAEGGIPGLKKYVKEGGKYKKVVS